MKKEIGDLTRREKVFQEQVRPLLIADHTSSSSKTLSKSMTFKTVVDVGCGDWTFSKEIHWGDVHYLGVDVVKSVVDEDGAKYGSENIHFQHMDILQDELPGADLLICKDVLMHLSINDVLLFLSKTYKYKHCLLTHNIGEDASVNGEITRGGFRPLDLSKSAFSLSWDQDF